MTKALGTLIILLLTAALLIISCGGGGGSTSTAVLNSTNASSVAGSIVTTIGLIVEPSYLGAKSEGNDNVKASKSFLKSLLNNALSNIQKSQEMMTVSGSADRTVSCTGGGTKKEVSSWSGSDSNPENYTGTITYTNCKEGTATWNGPVQITYQGTYQRPSRITTVLNGMTYADTSSNTSLTNMGLTTVYSDMVYSGSDITSASATITGNISGTVNGKGISSGYSGLKMSYSFSGSNMDISLSGKTTPKCINAEVTVSTVTNGGLAIGSRCPVSGSFNITDGVGNVRLDFLSGGAMTVLFNDQTVNSYSSCSQSEGMCI